MVPSDKDACVSLVRRARYALPLWPHSDEVSGSSMRPVRSVKANAWLMASLAALVVGISLRTADPSVAQVLTHGPVVGGVTDSTGNVFLRADQAATVAVQYSTDPNFATFSV